MNGKISCGDLAVLMSSESLYAVLDVRERGEFNTCQIANATSLPRSQIEFRIGALVPNVNVPLVVYDEAGERAELAARTLTQVGYLQVSVLERGLAGWQQDGLPTVSGINVPSKAFGERIYHEEKVPELTPEELKELQQKPADLIIIDVRTPEEYGRFCIPGARNVPGGDLILWAEELKRNPDRTIIVNCAGRTRSIIGAAALRRLGVNHVCALKNGTMGWVLAGFELETKPPRATARVPDDSRDQARALAMGVAEEEQIPLISPRDVLEVVAARPEAVIYLIDVRSESEYEAGHIPGSLSTPGGQAVQRADDFIAVRNARVLFISDQSVRAIMAAYWYRKMGFRDVRVLEGGLEAWRKSGGLVVPGAEQSEPLGLEASRNAASMLTAVELNSLIQGSSAVILDVGSSPEYVGAHIPGAKWISRGWLELKLPEEIPDHNRTVVLSCFDGKHSLLASRALTEIGYRNVFVLDGGVRRWIAARYPTESGLTACLAEPNDVVQSPSITGDQEAMRRYLEWEMKLAGG